jgi:putative SOS response-associated peptidase YedK
MCGRFSQLPVHLQAQLIEAMQSNNWPGGLGELPARYNLAPTQLAGVVHERAGQVAVGRMRWGLIPKGEKSEKFKLSTINARVETVAKSWTFRYAFQERRALIPMAGYFEWTEPAPKVKQPWFVHRPDGQTLWAAGLWEPPQTILPEGASPTFTIITTTARDQAGQVHDRMPVFLPLAELDGWLHAPVEAAQAMLAAFAVPPIAIYPVSRRVNRPVDDDPALLDPIDLEAA